MGRETACEGRRFVRFQIAAQSDGKAPPGAARLDRFEVRIAHAVPVEAPFGMDGLRAAIGALELEFLEIQLEFGGPGRQRMRQSPSMAWRE